MSSFKWTALLGLLVFSGLAGAQPKPSPGKDFKSRLNVLRQSYYTAVNKYYQPYEDAKTDEERAKIKLDPAKNPGKEFLPRYLALAKTAPKGDESFDLWQMILNLGRELNDNKAQTLALDHLLGEFVNSPRIVMVGSVLQGTKLMDRYNAAVAKSTNPEVRAGALYSRASSVGNWGQGDMVKAKTLYAAVIKKYPQTSYAKRAKGDIFEIDNLSVGKMAPDFEAKDENGADFKLSDYRGKVVVLDFWGFW